MTVWPGFFARYQLSTVEPPGNAPKASAFNPPRVREYRWRMRPRWSRWLRCIRPAIRATRSSLSTHTETTRIELIVTLHGQQAGRLDTGDDRWRHARTTSMGAMSARICVAPGGPRRDLSCEFPPVKRQSRAGAEDEAKPSCAATAGMPAWSLHFTSSADVDDEDVDHRTPPGRQAILQHAP